MKIKILALLTLILAAAGCDSWLDVGPGTEIKGEKMFETEQGFWDALTGIYIGMTSSDIYGGNLSWGAVEFMAWQHSNADNGGAYFDLQRCNYESAKPKATITAVWSKLYNVIAEINYLLYAADKYGGHLNPAVRNAIRGEALALRAYCHFDLIRLFAEGNLKADPSSLDKPCIPYVTRHNKQITGQKSYRETLAMLMDDVDDAIGLFGQTGDQSAVNMNMYMTRLGALVLRARIALWAGDPQTAEFAAQAISAIEEQNFVSWNSGQNASDRVFAGELVFSLSVYKLRNYLEYAFAPSMYGNANQNRLSMARDFVYNDIFEIDNGEVGGGSPSDMRLLRWYAPAEDDAEKMLAIKVRQDDAASQKTVPLIRISEAYLIAAEALLESDPETSIRYLNLIREKRNISSGYYIPEHTAADVLRRIIRQEYRREFAQEGQLFFYYKRTGTVQIPGSAAGDMTGARYLLPYPVIEQDFGRDNK